MQFLGSETSTRDSRSLLTGQPYSYVTDFAPIGVCPSKDGAGRDAFPYTCAFPEGGDRISTDELRVGAGLTRPRAGSRASMQLVGPMMFQHGNGTIASRREISASTRLRDGHRRQVLKGLATPSMELQGHSPFQFGQYATPGEITAVRGRHKYEYTTQARSLDHGPARPQSVETFYRGGISTREGTHLD